MRFQVPAFTYDVYGVWHDDRNDDFREIFEVLKLTSYDVIWTPRALLWVQEHSGNISEWFWRDSETSEN